MEQCQVDVLCAVNLELGQEPGRSSWPSVRCSPDEKPSGQFVRIKPILREYVNVGGPVCEGIETLWPEPVVVPGSEQHGHRCKPGKCIANDGRSIWGYAVVFVKVPTAAQHVGIDLLSQLHNCMKRVSKSLTPSASNIEWSPPKWRVEMQICE